MKYWLFHDNQVEGPYDREAMLEIDSFSPESLVCPEGRRGTSMGDWQRAGVISELAETLLKKARIPAGAVPGGEMGGSLLPPEPTLRDLAVLGTLQEKVNLLENALNQFQEDLRTRDDEVSALKADLDLKKQDAESLEGKVGELESQLKDAQSLKEDLNQARTDTSEQAKTIDDLRSQIESFRGEIDQVRSEAKQAAVVAAASPELSSALGVPVDSPEPFADGAQPPPGELEAGPIGELEAGPIEEGVLGEPALGEPGGDLEAPAPEPDPFPVLEGDAVPAADAPPGLEPLPEIGDAPEPFGDVAAPALESFPDPTAVGGDAVPALDAPSFAGPSALEALADPMAPAAGIPALDLSAGDAEAVPPGLVSPFENTPPAPGGAVPAFGEQPAPMAFDPMAIGGEPTPALQEFGAPGGFAPAGEIPNTMMGDTAGPGAGPEPFMTPGATPFPGAPAPAADGMIDMYATPGASADMAGVAADAASAEGLVELSTDAVAQAAAPKKKGKLVLVLLLLIIAAGAVAAAVYMGFIDIAALTGGKIGAKDAADSAPVIKKKTGPSADLPKDGHSAAASPDADGVDPQVGMPDQSQAAIELAKGYASGRTGKTLQMVLETHPQPGVEPWTVDTLGGDRYKVNFYESKNGFRSRVPTYQFEARMKTGTLSALNAKSQAVLDGEVPAKQAAKPAVKAASSRTSRRRKPRPRQRPRQVQDSGLLADPLSSLLDEDSEPQPLAPPSRAERKAPEPSDSYMEADETQLPPAEAADEAPEPKKTTGKRRSRSHSAPTKSREELTLDELLLPGIPKP
ncbi:MAG: hypothetical protein ABIJ96_14990 [Elusimicrobiota bacterium]